MPSLKEVRDILLISLFQGLINDEELLLLYDLNRSTNLDLPYEYYDSVRIWFAGKRRVFIGISISQAGYSPFSRRTAGSWCDNMLPKKCLYWFGGPLRCSQETGIPLPICRYDSQICKTCSSLMYDQQLYDRLHISGAQSQNSPVERHATEPPCSLYVRNCHHSPRLPFGELFRVYWWDC